jgi:hypothetical protein
MGRHRGRSSTPGSHRTYTPSWVAVRLPQGERYSFKRSQLLDLFDLANKTGRSVFIVDNLVLTVAEPAITFAQGDQQTNHETVFIRKQNNGRDT